MISRYRRGNFVLLTSNPVLSERDILKLPIPKVPGKAAKEIITQSRQAHQSRQEAQTLLVNVKRAVEIAIEEGEGKALLLLQP
jgi:Fe-S cluster biosynthesis and repair protein YggX